jgi:hypothetical protein
VGPSALVLAAVTGLALAGAAAATPIRTAGPSDDAPHAGDARTTEWWYANAIDPRSGMAVALSVGPEAAGAAPASVAFLYLPDGRTFTVAAPRISAPGLNRSAAGGPDVRLGPDRFVETAPGVWRIRVDASSAIAVAGGNPGPVLIDLVLRTRAPGFVAGPLRFGDQSMSWTVAAPTARADGTVRVGGRTFRLRGAAAYHDHNFGPFDLRSDVHGGWDWSQLHLPRGRALVLGLVKPRDVAETSGGLVLSGARGRLAAAPSTRFHVGYARWRRAGGFWYPATETLTARLSDGQRVRLRFRALGAAPLPVSGDGAIVEVRTRADGVLTGAGRRPLRVRGAPGFYEYESTAVERARDGAPT